VGTRGHREVRDSPIEIAKLDDAPCSYEGSTPSAACSLRGREIGMGAGNPANGHHAVASRPVLPAGPWDRAEQADANPTFNIHPQKQAPSSIQSISRTSTK
jgi:hypothetical protein